MMSLVQKVAEALAGNPKDDCAAYAWAVYEKQALAVIKAPIFDAVEMAEYDNKSPSLMLIDEVKKHESEIL